jgi:carbon storage regulator
MLVLSRKIGQSIIINDNIEVTIAAIIGQQIRVGVTAPKEIIVHRKEVYDRIKNNEESNDGYDK